MTQEPLANSSADSLDESLADAVERLEQAAAMLIGADLHAVPATDLNLLMERLGAVSAIRSRPLFTGRIRDAVIIRDRGCTHSICDEPVTRCDADHVVPWPGGDTSEPNGRAKCRFHHNHKTRGPRP